MDSGHALNDYCTTEKIMTHTAQINKSVKKPDTHDAFLCVGA